MTKPADALDTFIDTELAQPVMKAARFLAQKISDDMGEQAAAVLFYGSCLRTGDAAGLMDFYILTSGAEGYGNGALSRFAHTLMPPFVRYFKCEYEGERIHAKIAVMTLARFEALAGAKALDISIWARFAQPSAMVLARDDAAKNRVHGAIRNAIKTAASWAVCFGPQEGKPGEYWRALFRKTYAAELRIEDQSRADQIVELAASHYDDVFIPALTAIGFSPMPSGQEAYHVSMADKHRRAMKRKWLLCQIVSKSVNLVRILKGAVTFEGRGDYVIWKIERRTGQPLSLTPWQQAHPLLASPRILFQMWRQGAFQKSR